MPEATPENLIERRRTSLLKLWAAGKRLTTGEMEEIADQLPKPASALVLEAQVEGRPDRPYQRLQVEYAGVYSQSIRTIKRWVKDNAPLDEPAMMPGWWEKTYKKRVPAKLLELARSQTLSIAPSPINSEAPTQVAQAVSENQQREGGVALDPVEQARVIAQAAFQEVEDATRSKEPGRLALAQRAYKEAAKELRNAELAAPKINAAAGAVIEKEKVRTVLTLLHTSIVQSLRSFCKRGQRLMMGKTAAEQEAIWQAECDKLFAGFRDCEFADPV